MKKSYVVCSTVRSGSTLLCKSLEKLGYCGKPEEYFHRHTIKRLKLGKNPDRFLEYCNSVLQKGVTKNGIFGIKMHWWQLSDFLTLARQSTDFKQKQDLEILHAIFPNLKFIYLWRQDITAQAVSAAIAMQTNQWEKFSRSEIENQSTNKQGIKKDAEKSIKFQPWKIYQWEKSLQDQNQYWRQFFRDNCLDYYEINYENLIDSFTQEISNIINYLDIDMTLATEKIGMPTQRQFNQTNQQFMKYYRRLPKFFLAVLYRLYLQLKSKTDQ